MDTKPTLSPAVILILWSIRVLFILMLPGLWMKLWGIVLLVAMPFAKRFIVRQMQTRLTP